jgi:three-Cys-motif partner protein
MTEQSSIVDSDAVLEASDDGLPCPEVGAWTETKHSFVSLYAKLFSSGMKAKWGRRVYVELYAGAGYSRVRGTSRVIAGSPLRALTLEDPFDEYVFCEEDPENLKALKVRVKRHAPGASVAYVEGDCNARVIDILAKIPTGSKSDTVLTLCFVDPFDIGIEFETVRVLSARFVDFLVLLAVFMDANRNYDRYVKADDVRVGKFLGSESWRDRWYVAQKAGTPFPQFLASEYANGMESLRYLKTPLHTMNKVRSDEKNLPLYYLAMFSRHERAYKFWDEARKYGTDQTKFPWG